MRTSIYVLAFLLPLKGAVACPKVENLKPFFTDIQDRLKNDKKDLPLVIEGTTYLVLRATGAATNYGMLSTAKLKVLRPPAPKMCAYSASDNEKDMSFILQPTE